MMMRVRIHPLLILCLLAAGALSACGGGNDFSGDPKVPDGYKTFSTAGIPWPAGFGLEGAVEITPPEKARTPYGLIQLVVSPKAGDRFDSLVDQSRIVVRDVNNGKIESDEEVDVPGSKRALRSKTVTPAGRGSDPVEVRAEGLDVLRDNGDVIGFTVASPQRDGQEFDPAPIVDSFRLKG